VATICVLLLTRSGEVKLKITSELCASVRCMLTDTAPSASVQPVSGVQNGATTLICVPATDDAADQASQPMHTRSLFHFCAEQ
jgi:hypothetical protein